MFRRDDPSGSDSGRNKERRGGGPSRRPTLPNPGGRPMRTLAFWAFLVLLSLVAFRMYQGMSAPRVEMSYTRFIQEVEKGNLANLQIVENAVTGELKNE